MSGTFTIILMRIRREISHEKKLSRCLIVAYPCDGAAGPRSALQPLIMNSLTSTLRSSVLLLGLALTAQTASASFMPVFLNTTGSGPFTFNYNLNFSTLGPVSNPRLDSGAYVTIYDIAGYVSHTAPAIFSVTPQLLGISEPVVNPNDDPALMNLTFRYNGPSLTLDIVFPGFTIVSTFGFTALDHYTSIFTNASNNTQSSEIGSILVPSATPTGGPGPNVPDGGSTIALFGSALFGLAMLRRRFVG